jgi:hypothetical protein
MALNMDAMLRIKADVQGENNIRRLGNSMQGLQGRAKNAALGFNSLKGAVAGFGAVIAGSAIVGGLGAMIKKSVDLGDALGKLSTRTGVAQDALIGMRNAAALSDVSNESLAKSLAKLNVNLVEAVEGNATLQSAFKRLGVDIKGADGQVISTEQAMKRLADRFADMPDGVQKTAAAVAVFGRSGADLIPLLNGGAEAMDKFTYKVSNDFSARSELFNDTITILGFKTQGFGLELTDALLPALQSILEVFGDLFSTDQDWTALFEVIKFGLRSVATVIYAMIKLVDQLIKAVVYSSDAIGKALQGDFQGAGRALSQGFGAGLEQAKRDFQQIGKLFTDAAPGTGSGRRTGRGLGFDTSVADREAKTRAAASRKAAKEEERLEQQRQTLQEQAFDLQEKLRRSIEDTRAAYAAVGLSAAEALSVQRGNELIDATRTTNDLVDNLVDLANKFAAVGVSFDMKPTIDLINEYGKALANVADAEYNQGLKDLLPSLEEYDAKIAEVTRGKTELTELEKLNAQVNLLQLDILAQTNPALAEHVDLLRQRAAALDEATKKQEENNNSFGKRFSQSFEDGIKSMGDLAGNLGSSFASAFEGMADQLTEFVTTGKANFRDFAASVLKDISRMIIRYAIFNAVRGILNAFNPGAAAAPLVQAANGRVFAQNGIQPFARGGIVDRPTLFPFAKGTGLMGEAGPEAIMPLKRGADGKLGVAANLDGAMSRYRRSPGAGGGGGEGGGTAESGSAAGGGPMAIDVRYSVERINDVEYVTSSQFQAGIRQAAQQGAVQGEQRALRQLQQNTSVRGRVGLR